MQFFILPQDGNASFCWPVFSNAFFFFFFKCVLKMPVLTHIRSKTTEQEVPPQRKYRNLNMSKWSKFFSHTGSVLVFYTNMKCGILFRKKVCHRLEPVWLIINQNVSAIYLQVTKYNRQTDFHDYSKWKYHESCVHVFHNSMSRFKRHQTSFMGDWIFLNHLCNYLRSGGRGLPHNSSLTRKRNSKFQTPPKLHQTSDKSPK